MKLSKISIHMSRLSAAFISTATILLGITSLQAVPVFAASATTAPTFSNCKRLGYANVETSADSYAKNFREQYNSTQQYGNDNTCVRSLQSDLNYFYGYCAGGFAQARLVKVTVDGQYGSATRQAVKDFQAYEGYNGSHRVNNAGIKVDGITGTATWALMHFDSCSDNAN